MPIDYIYRIFFYPGIFQGSDNALLYRFVVRGGHAAIAPLPPTVYGTAQYFGIYPCPPGPGAVQRFQYYCPCPASGNKTGSRCAHGSTSFPRSVVITGGQNTHSLKTAPYIGAGIAATSYQHPICLAHAYTFRSHDKGFRTRSAGR